MKTLVINGSSGFLGSQICKYFENKYHIVRINRADYLLNPSILAEKIKGADIVFNLAGARISLFPSNKYKQVIYDSRIRTTQNLCKALDLLKDKPDLFISMSAVGIYDGNHIHDESSTNFGEDFLARICIEWEHATMSKSLLENTLVIRSGIVLSKNSVIFKKMIIPCKFGFGVIIGSGKQAFPFIHILDFLRAIDFAIDRHLTGIVNFVAPTFCTNQEFVKSICLKMNRTLVFRVPAFFLKVLMGDQSSMLLEGQRVVPKGLTDNGFVFTFSEIDSAIEDLINSK